ncbi:hypothetical protein GCM10009534_28860 [Kribbella sandramycini]
MTRWGAVLAGAALALGGQLPAQAAGGTQPNPSGGLDRIDQRDRPLDKSYSWTQTGAGVRAYVVSPGVSVTHTDFGGRASVGADLVGGPSTSGCTTMGTGVAGLVAGNKYGVAKGANIVSVRAFACNQAPTAAQATAAIKWVTANAVKPAVGVLPYELPADTALDNALRASTQAGISWVVDAGGDASDLGGNACNFSPGRVSEAITVTRLDLTRFSGGKERLAFGAHRGTCVDLAAPDGTTAIGGGSDENPWGIANGGQVGPTAGAAAKILEQTPTATPALVQQELRDTATSGRLAADNVGTPNLILFSN